MRAHPSPANIAMKEHTRQERQRTPEETYSEFGEVRVISRPVPDAEDRLRRLFTLLLDLPTADGQAAPADGAPPHERHVDYHLEREA